MFVVMLVSHKHWLISFTKYIGGNKSYNHKAHYNVYIGSCFKRSDVILIMIRYAIYN